MERPFNASPIVVPVVKISANASSLINNVILDANFVGAETVPMKVSSKYAAMLVSKKALAEYVAKLEREVEGIPQPISMKF